MLVQECSHRSRHVLLTTLGLLLGTESHCLVFLWGLCHTPRRYPFSPGSQGPSLGRAESSHPYPHPPFLVKLPALRCSNFRGRAAQPATFFTGGWPWSKMTRNIWLGSFTYVLRYSCSGHCIFFGWSWENRNGRDSPENPQIVSLGPASLF